MAAKDQFGPNSRATARGAVGLISGRSTEGRFLRSVERDLLEHLVRPPTAAEQLLITRAARLALHLEQMDMEASESGGLSAKAVARYVAGSNALSRLLTRLGVGVRAKGRHARSDTSIGPSLADFVEAHDRARAAG
jgi:hypothetical protein